MIETEGFPARLKERDQDSMEQIVSFPGLGIEPFSMNRIAFSLFGRPIYWYGLLIAGAFLAGIAYILSRSRRFGLDSDRVMDVLLAAMIGAIVGARVYYVIFSWDQYKDNLLKIFQTWEGGLAVYGGILGGVLVGYFFCKRRGVRFWPAADVAMCGLLLGQAIGRWGNFVNVEAFGSVTTLPWRMCSPSIASYLYSMHFIDEPMATQILDGTLGVHPTFFYESAWCLLGFVLLTLYTKHRRFDGEMTLLYMLWYGLERSIVEGLRTDSLMAGSYRVSQMLSAGLVLLAVILLAVNYRRIRRSRDPEQQMLYVYTEESRAMLAQVDRQRREKSATKADPKPSIAAENQTKNDEKTMQTEQGEMNDAGKTD